MHSRLLRLLCVTQIFLMHSFWWLKLSICDNGKTLSDAAVVILMHGVYTLDFNLDLSARYGLKHFYKRYFFFIMNIESVQLAIWPSSIAVRARKLPTIAPTDKIIFMSVFMFMKKITNWSLMCWTYSQFLSDQRAVK